MTPPPPSRLTAVTERLPTPLRDAAYRTWGLAHGQWPTELADIVQPILAHEYVVKVNHASGGVIVDRWLATSYRRHAGAYPEWAYRGIRRRVFLEEAPAAMECAELDAHLTAYWRLP